MGSESLDRPVSIKVMEGDALADEVARQRFENEARTIARLSHPNIVAIHEVGRAGDGRMYYIMPYLASGDLSQRDLREDEARIATALRSLLSALGYAHARSIVHRDVKRENVLFDADDRPMLADFGIALTKSDDARITTAGLTVGSSGYMAPEQARGEVVDGRADLYSVGVLAYELLTGELPYRASDALALALMHVQDPIPRLPQGKRHWQAFIDRAMAKSRDARYQNAQEMAQALDPIERRSGNQLSSRMLRTLGGTGDGGRWKGPLALVAGAAVLVAGGLFARDRFASHGAAPAPAVVASPAAAPGSPAHAASAASSTARCASIASQQQRIACYCIVERFLRCQFFGQPSCACASRPGAPTSSTGKRLHAVVAPVVIVRSTQRRWIRQQKSQTRVWPRSWCRWRESNPHTLSDN